MGNELGGMSGHMEPLPGATCKYCDYKPSSGFGCVSPPHIDNTINNKTVTRCCDQIVHRDCYGIVRMYLPNCPLCKEKTVKMIPLGLVKYPKFNRDGSVIPMEDQNNYDIEKKTYLFKNILSRLDDSYQGNSESPFGQRVEFSISPYGSSGMHVHSDKSEYHSYVKIIREILMPKPQDIELPESEDDSYESSASYNSDTERFREHDHYYEYGDPDEEEEKESLFKEHYDNDELYESLDRIKIKYGKKRMIKNAFYDYKDHVKYISDDETDYSNMTDVELIQQVQELKLKNEKLELANEYKDQVIYLLEY